MSFGNVNASPPGATIATLKDSASLAEIIFDNLKLRWNATTDRIEIATVAGTETVRYVSSITYSAAQIAATISGGAGSDASTDAAPLVVTTTFQAIGDLGIVAVETRLINLKLASGNWYRVTLVHSGTTGLTGTTDWSIDKIGITSAQILGGDAGIAITNGQISNANTMGKNSPIATAQTGTEIACGELKFRYSLNATNGNLDIQSATAATVAFRSYGQEYFPAIGINRNMVYLAGTAPATGTTWQSLPVGAAGTNEQLNYEIVTAANVYLVKIFNFADTNITILVQKAI